MWNESLTYNAKTPSKQRPNAAPPTLKPVTTPVKKWRLSNINHNDNNPGSEQDLPTPSFSDSLNPHDLHHLNFRQQWNESN